VKPTNVMAAVIAAAFATVFVPARGQAADAKAWQWYRCNTHTHTSAPAGSDANGTPEFVAQWYRSHGYQCVVITDHELLTDVAPLNKKFGGDGGFLVLQGQEITQIVADPRHPGGVRHAHVNGINTTRPIMPVLPDSFAGKAGLLKLAATGISVSQSFQRNVAEIEHAGGLPQINHPNLSWSVELADLLPLTQPFLLEIWNAFPTSNNLGGPDEARGGGASTEALWDSLLSRGKVVWGVAADDAHEYYRFEDREAPTPGKGWIVLQAESLTAPAMTSAMRQGQFYASTGISLTGYSADDQGISIQIAPAHEWSPNLQPSARYVTRFIGANGRVLAEVSGMSPQYRLKGDEQYVRASIIDSDGRRAWTQPMFLDKRR
jgi:hypothetical protein